MPNKGKSNIYDSVEAEKRFKFKEDPLVEILSLEIEAKNQQ